MEKRKYLFDTHILLWYAEDSKRLTQEMKDILTNTENNELYYSMISVWETEIKRLAHPGKILDISTEEFTLFCRKKYIQELPLEAHHIATLKTLARPESAPPHNDPFDRILIAQAKSENMTFITHDDSLITYTEPCIVFL